MRSHSLPKLAGLVLVVAAASGWLIATRVTATGVRQEAAKLAEVLGLRTGNHVADIGAGKGSLAFEVARLVGPTGHVFATEIDSERRRQIQSAAKRRRFPTCLSWKRLRRT